jgi:hypothetical protein
MKMSMDISNKGYTQAVNARTARVLVRELRDDVQHAIVADDRERVAALREVIANVERNWKLA